MEQYYTALKLYNFVFWMSIIGLFITMAFIYFFMVLGATVNWSLWVGIGFYLLCGVYGQLQIKIIEKEIKEHE